jgi:fatty-acyl-CoA synthase
VALVVRPGSVIGHVEITTHLEPRLARYKLPKGATVLDALPRTGSGKIQKAVLRALLLERLKTGEPA